MGAIVGFIVTGAVVGLISGLLGVGGGTILVPIFTIIFGMGTLSATATSLFTIIPTSLSGMISHIQGRTCDPKVGFAMGLGGACASPIGVSLAQISPEWLVVTAVSAIILYSAITTLHKAWKTPKVSFAQLRAARAEAAGAGSSAPGSKAAALASQELEPFSVRRFFVSFAIGFLAGLAGGYVGLGGGFLMVPLMANWLGFPMRLTSGTSLIGIMCIAIPGAIAQAIYGNVDFLAGILVACGSIPAAIVGARLVKRFPDRTLRFMFAAFLGVAAVLLIVKQSGLLA